MFDRLETIHPMIVHFPIVLIIGSLAAFAAYAATRREFFVQAGSWTVTLGAVASAAAVIAGKVAEAHASHNAEAHVILERLHEPLGYTVLVLTAGLTIWGFASRWKFRGANLAAFLCALTLTAIVTAATGHYGATMVYEHGMGVNPAVLKPSAHGHDHDSQGSHEAMPKRLNGSGSHAHEQRQGASHNHSESGDLESAPHDNENSNSSPNHEDQDHSHSGHEHEH